MGGRKNIRGGGANAPLAPLAPPLTITISPFAPFRLSVVGSHIDSNTTHKQSVKQY